MDVKLSNKSINILGPIEVNISLSIMGKFHYIADLGINYEGKKKIWHKMFFQYQVAPSSLC